MDIKNSEPIGRLQRSVPKRIRVGSFIRVKVLDRLNGNSFRVEIGGGRYVARLQGSIKSRMFVAKVLKLSPKLELQFMKDLEDVQELLQTRFLQALLKKKNLFIQNLVATDKICIHPKLLMQKEKKSLKTFIKESIKNQSTTQLMKRFTTTSQGRLSYFVLQNLYNLLAYDSYVLLLPFILGNKQSIIDLRTFGGKESENFSFFIIVHLENEKKIGFFIYVDYEMMSCTISTNSASIETLVKSNIQILEHELKTLNYNKKIEIRFSPYSEDNYLTLSSLRRIDIKM